MSAEFGDGEPVCPRVLVVEDDRQIAAVERFILEAEGYVVDHVWSGEEAMERLAEAQPDLVLLDVGLPGLDGFATCVRLRELTEAPIIMVTGQQREDDKVHGLEVGADDYVTKPFSVNELLARIKAALRRPSLGPPEVGPTRGSPDPPSGAGQVSAPVGLVPT